MYGVNFHFCFHFVLAFLLGNQEKKKGSGQNKVHLAGIWPKQGGG